MTGRNRVILGPTMTLTFRRFDLVLTHAWAIATDVNAGRVDGKTLCPVVFVDLEDSSGLRGLGEASPSSQYGETWETVFRFLQRVDARRLSFSDLPGSMAYLESLPDPSMPAICAVNLALLDGAAKAAGLPMHAFLGLEFPAGGRVSSFTIGLDTPERIGSKALEAASYPVLKMKLGSPADRENLAALRRAAPGKTVRVDANAAWKTKEEALERIEWLATDGAVEFVEQPMPAGTPASELAWLKARSPLPLVGDESYQDASDATLCAECYHGVNVKLVKTGGVTAGKAALEAARSQGLRTMLGCMIESSVLVTAAAHLAALTDWLDLDGNVLITNDPYRGVLNTAGLLDFGPEGSRPGLGVLAA